MNYHKVLEILGIIFIIEQVVGFIANRMTAHFVKKKKDLIDNFRIKNES